jgi:Skp family chaperone for outer membrane proteins
MKRFAIALAVLATGFGCLPGPAVWAQSNDYFIPNRPASPPRQASPRQPAEAPPPAAPPQPIQAPMPPVPDLPALPKGTAPPAAVIGVIGIPEVMRASTAAQQVDKVITERREKLNEDVQKEQQHWRDMQQALAKQRNSLSPEQVRAKERELQDRISAAQRNFQSRGRIIQEAAQYGLNQIQASLVAVIRQVAESRGMNLVLHRAQVALNVNEFDITEQVATELNKVLPTVTIPPDGVSPNAAQPPAAGQPAAPAPAAAGHGAAPAPKRP